MSVQQQEFSRLLRVLMSTNNEQRKAAEDHYNAQLMNNNHLVLQHLLTVFGHHQEDPVLRLFAAVLLRRGIEQSFSQWPPSATEDFKLQVFQAWKHETNCKLSLKLAHVMGQVCLKVDWEDLIPQTVTFVNQHLQSSSSTSFHVIVNAARLFEIVADYAPQDVTTHYQLLGDFLAPFLGSDNKEVRFSCAKTVAAVVAAVEDDSARNAFKSVITPLLGVLHATLSQGDEVEATQLMDHLVTVAQLQPMFFKSAFDSLAAAMLQVGHADQLEFSTRTMALEVLVTISESAPAMARRTAGFVEKLVDLILQLMLAVDEDEQSWQRESYAHDDFDEDAEAGDEALERIAAGLGGKSITEIVLSRVQTMLQQPHWKFRRAAVSAVCRLGEGATKHFTKYLDSVIPFLSNCLQDPSVRVQYEAIQVGLFVCRCGVVHRCVSVSFMCVPDDWEICSCV
jgi:importin-5